MAEKAKMSDRDKTLINILERMADQIQKQGLLLEDISNNQAKYAKMMDSVEFNRDSFQSGTDKSLGSIGDSISRYRSDMLSLVHEQDSINNNLKELNKMVHKTTYSMEDAALKLAEIGERVKTQDKVVSAHYEHALKQAEIIPKEIADTSRSLARLHADTEKHLGEQHRENQRQFEKLQHETLRHLLVLEGFDTALKTLLVRTEPPEKKPLLIVRLFNRIVFFFRVKLPLKTKGIRTKSD